MSEKMYNQNQETAHIDKKQLIAESKEYFLRAEKVFAAHVDNVQKFDKMFDAPPGDDTYEYKKAELRSILLDDIAKAGEIMQDAEAELELTKL